jgi:DNA-binding NarL/FixJ family response regulator
LNSRCKPAFGSRQIDFKEQREMAVAIYSGNATVRSLGRLTRRERHVLAHVAQGLSNKEIAVRLGLSEKTVRNHLSRVFVKLEARNRTEAVMTALRSGLQIWP